MSPKLPPSKKPSAPDLGLAQDGPREASGTRRPGRPPLPLHVWVERFQDASARNDGRLLTLREMASAVGSTPPKLEHLLELHPTLADLLAPARAIPGGPKTPAPLSVSQHQLVLDAILKHTQERDTSVQEAWASIDPDRRVPLSDALHFVRESRRAPSTPEPSRPTPRIAPASAMEALAALTATVQSHQIEVKGLKAQLQASQEDNQALLQEKFALLDERLAMRGQHANLEEELREIKEYAGLRDLDHARMEEENTLLRAEVESLRKENASTANLLTKTQDDLQKWLHVIAAHRGTLPDGPITAEASPDDFLAALEGSKSLEAGLIAIEKLYPERVTVLPEALKSARKWSQFKHPGTAMAMLVKLATTYLDAVLTGRDPIQAGIFTPDGYGQHESQETLQMEPARKARTFTYQGEPTLFESHLKIGVKPDPQRIWRCYFIVDPVARKIIIGHSGEHLPISSGR